ncbi:hypothetical protein SS50377_21193 [Spironucleus salmonicida]|uniref:Uncharacterized protein n=1 Tax=Spironucleus salmonicida TaxID=348837 RepID=V6LI22_9EUKA|nr:hypothetical protein SS50377_21193 [Spironucleus salmonicida]|eukprot:EST43968.1 hypothetical protein SS50377_16275 [Spironucleus salmonicida]
MASIPYKPRGSINQDIGPTYYNASRPSGDTKVKYSTSSKGSSCMASAVDRFPLRHSHWGMPEPGKYDPQLSLKKMTQSSLACNPDVYSATFQTTSRDNYVYQPQITLTPGPGAYNKVSTIKQNQLYQKQQSYKKLKEKSQVQQMIRQAAQAQKSLSQFTIENDENYIPMKDPMKLETLDRRPLENPLTDKMAVDLHRYEEFRKVETLKDKYKIETQPPNTLLGNEIQAEIEESIKHYQELQGQPIVTKPINAQQMRELVQEHLKRIPFNQTGIAFGTRETSEMIDQVKQQEQEQKSLLGPGRYDAQIDFQKVKRDGQVPLQRQSSRNKLEVINDISGSIFKVGNDKIPPVGTYNIKVQGPKSFLLNEEQKWV